MERMDLTGFSTDQLEQEVVALEAIGSRVRAEQMLLVGELDRRQVALGDGCKSMSEWVAGRLDVAPETAATLVRTTRRLQDLPETSKRLQAGEMSFDRVVELARLADGEDEQTLLDRAWQWDVAGLRRRVAARRRLTPADEQRMQREQHLVMQPNLDRSRWDIWGAVPGVAGAVIDRALQERADSLPTLPDMRSGRAHRNALALTAICQDTLDGAVAAGGSAAPLATVFVDATLAAASDGEAGVTVAAGPRVGPDTLQAILCAGRVEVIVDPGEGMPIAAGPGHPWHRTAAAPVCAGPRWWLLRRRMHLHLPPATTSSHPP
jgi:hypothetical protein